MARKQSANPKRPSRPQPRHQPCSRNLPIYNRPSYPGRPIEPHHEWDETAEVRNEFRQVVARGPYTPSSDGPPTPSSSTLSSDTISRNISPCLTNTSLHVEYSHIRSPLGAPTPGPEEHYGAVYINQPYQAGPSYDFTQTLPPYNSWQPESRKSAQSSTSPSHKNCPKSGEGFRFIAGFQVVVDEYLWQELFRSARASGPLSGH
jgi:hypothetical protein